MVCYWRELLELLPPWLREPVDGSGLDKQVREIRLHLGQPPLLAAGSEDYFPTCRRVGTEDLSYAVNTASRFSAYAAWSVAQGYLTARGGHRLGLCGTAVIREGHMTGMKELRSVCIRVARDFPGLAAGLPDHFFRRNPLILKAGHVQHTPHQAAQAFDLAGDQSQIFPLPLRRDGTVQDAVHIAADGGHRRL